MCWLDVAAPNTLTVIVICLQVMELMRCSFRDLLNQNPKELTLQVKGKILHETCLGLKYLHSRKPVVIHRDLKSMNVLVDDNMTAKLTDFGISRAKQSAAQALTSFSGTVAWMAPELLRYVSRLLGSSPAHLVRSHLN